MKIKHIYFIIWKKRRFCLLNSKFGSSRVSPHSFPCIMTTRVLIIQRQRIQMNRKWAREQASWENFKFQSLKIFHSSKTCAILREYSTSLEFENLLQIYFVWDRKLFQLIFVYKKKLAYTNRRKIANFWINKGNLSLWWKQHYFFCCIFLSSPLSSSPWAARILCHRE